MRRNLLLAAAVAVALFPALSISQNRVQAVATPADGASSPSLPDYDVRTASLAGRSTLDRVDVSSNAASKAAPPRFASGIRIEQSALTGGPRLVVPIDGTLTGPSSSAPEAVARQYLRDNAAAYGLTDHEIDGLDLVREYATADLGVTHLTFVQQAGGRRIYGADIRMAVDSQGRVVWAGGELVQNSDELASQLNWALGPVDAAASAALATGHSASPVVVASKGGPENESIVDAGGAFTEPARVRQMLFPIGRGVLRPAWNVLLAERGVGNIYVVTVDAENGKLLARNNLTHYLGSPTNAKFATFTKDSPQPDLPHVSNNPTAVDRTLVGLPPGALQASPFGWVGSEPITAGNNVRAAEDHAATNFGGATAAGNSDFVFQPALDFPIDRNKANTDAAIVNLFYWNNFAHDYLYRLGFDEAAGNFQAVNFTGAGRGNDAVNADAQDGAGTNNANFSAPPDGGAGRMQMFLWNGGFDGDFDQTIILHEYCHGLSTRLIGGPDYVDGLTGPQSGGMGEGWSDWYALTILSNADEDPSQYFVEGAYATRDFSSGVRHFAYSTDMRRNPLTYSDIDPSTADVFSNPTEVHSVGEVWCAALWEVRANFIAAYGPADGKALVERLVTDGMKFSVNNPSFTDARDGILVADQVRTGGQNQCLIWKGFAKRGVGYGAFTLNGSATTVKESFDLPPWCEPNGKPSFDSTSYDEESQQVTVSVGDSDLAAATTAAATLTSSSGDTEAVSLARTTGIPGLFAATLPLQRGAAASGNGTLDVRIGDTITLTYADASNGGATRTATARIVRRVSLFSDRMESGPTSWKTRTFELTTERAASPTHSWTDSPGRNYSDETTYQLQLKQAFDLRDVVGSRLVFNQRFLTEPGYDLCLVEVRAKGVNWKTVAVFSGAQPDFMQSTIDLSAFDGKDKVKVRFRLVSDQLVNDDGWHIDDVDVQTGRTQ